MKHFTKAAMITAASMLAVTGCSDKDSGTSDAAGTGSDSAVTLKFMTQSSPLAPADPNQKLIFQRMEQKTGIHIEWKNYTSETFAEKRNLALATGDLPDAIFDAGLGDYDLLRLAKDGTIIPLDDLIEKMPNFKKVLEQAPQYKSLITAPDGHIYSLPWIEELGAGKESIHSVDDFPWINVEWLKKLGLQMPTTTEELKQVLIAFKTKDPNGNGKADEIPLSFINKTGGEDLAFLFGSFGLGENWDHTVVTDDGRVRFTSSDPGFKEGVKFLHELVQEGLVDVEAFTQDWNTYLAKGKEGRYGLYFTWDKANISGANDKYDLMPALKGPSGEKNVTRTNGMGFDRGRMVVTKENKNLEATAKWMDQLYDPLQSVQNNWGTYGDTAQQNIFELDPSTNMLKHLPLNGTAPVELRQKTSVGGPLAILDSYYGKVTTKPDDAAWRLDLMKKVMVPDMKAKQIYPRVFFSLEELDRLSAIETDLFAYVLRMRTEWMENGRVEAEWADYLKELDRLGLQEWLKIKQAGYDRSVTQ
ncbi:ABC transporter substrate-binding protein [Paenibacillus mucilaginosus]|uniref:Family 1 extracellular solute-binding protein n=3 Tax=Paenibacillus mucilaginosus TaxID=61624 RepID=H6NJB7_9BACL|nr:ABC transporter substrate-binding protein [Paenibacillus mucilaginosus]AEI40575.1 extracellular solute-binding protein family 1 [Paenibacillus mucilaginosus KNP414]AFC29196.1 family 1 extracellular solute-binding protein [Paenibacillus mucilaginosus 3016]AFH61369.1 ABC transporter substrate-binding protein [Paenibacillus mucilaginosus K02]MCG7216293.1 ABC transporter substrate-binding protein [Paenibacillus mucilaginosus]WDM29730.1 ABC transporter substrate-binding protein [Paenibacillus mu